MQFTQGLHRAVQQKPDAIATIFEGRQQSFRQLRERVARLAGGLQHLGIREGYRVAILALNSDRHLEASLAIAWAGAVRVAVDPQASVETLVAALQDCECTALFIDDAFVSKLDPLLDGAMFLRRVVLMGQMPPPPGCHSHEQLIEQHTGVADIGSGGEALCGIYYEAAPGDTPRGVMLSHGAIGSAAMALLVEGALPDGAVALHSAAMHQLAETLFSLCLLMRGARQVLSAELSAPALYELVRQQNVSDLLLVPDNLARLADYAAAYPSQTASLQRLLYFTGAAAPASLAPLRQALPNAALLQVYGAAESAGVTALLAVPASVDSTAPVMAEGAIGRAALQLQLSLIDEQGEELAPGLCGQMRLKGPYLMQAYLNQDEASAAVLREGWLHSGRRARMDHEGFLFLDAA